MNANIARHLERMSAAQPGATALKVPRGRTAAGDIDYLSLSFKELLEESDAWCARLLASGIRRGDRVLVMVKPGLPLIAVVFALFKAGAVPVVIDPGMGLASFLSCVRSSRPRALVGIALAQVLSRVCFRAFASVRIRVRVAGSLTARIAGAGAAAAEAATAEPGDLAAILFTSGSTGAPKGVCYEHGMFDAQVQIIRDTYGIEPGEIDLPLLPIFALFNPALGMTSIIPEMDPRRPAQADPAKIVRAIRQEKVTNSFGSPTLWSKVARHCAETGTELPSLRRVLCAGAPVPADLWRASAAFLSSGTLHSPYGATEALPVTTVSAGEIDPASTRGACVGRPVEGMTVRIIPISDAPIDDISRAPFLPAGEIGEIVVSGPVVTRSYDGLPEATQAAKIPGGSGGVWHRMGDCGVLDPEGRLWFLGRKVERVAAASGTLFTEPCEQVFRAHPRARRCALVSVRGEPAIVAEARINGPDDGQALAGELRALGRAQPQTAAIGTFYFREGFPVDVRHNAKIHRLALARWAEGARPFRVA